MDQQIQQVVTLQQLQNDLQIIQNQITQLFNKYLGRSEKQINGWSRGKLQNLQYQLILKQNEIDNFQEESDSEEEIYPIVESKNGLISQKINIVLIDEFVLVDEMFDKIQQRLVVFLNQQGKNIKSNNFFMIFVCKCLYIREEKVDGDVREQVEDRVINVLLNNFVLKKQDYSIKDLIDEVLKKLIGSGFQLKQLKIVSIRYFEQKWQKSDLLKIKSFQSVQNRSYHLESVFSTSNLRICIWESFYFHYISNEKIEKKQLKINIQEELKKLPKEIQQLIKYGFLVQSLIELKKYYKIKENIYIKDFRGCLFFWIVLTDNEYFEQQNIEIECKYFLYDKQHVSPGFQKKQTQKEIQVNKNIKIRDPNQCKYILSNKIKYIKEQKVEKYIDNYEEVMIQQEKIEKLKPIICGFDLESTRNKQNGKQEVFCLCFKIEEEEYKYYGKQQDCIQQFIQKLDTIVVKTCISKTQQKVEIQQYRIYSHNGSKYDNILIYKEMCQYFQMDLKCICEGNSIKCMKIFNVQFFDTMLYYPTSLEKLCKSYKLQIQKTIYPYTFPQQDNLDYIGEIPDKKYFKNEQDYNEFCQIHQNKPFNLKEITEEYCMNDVRLVYQIGKQLQNTFKGKFNGIEYDLSGKLTTSSISFGIYQKCFLQNDLLGSPLNIQIDEQLSYKGGRTENFQDWFKNNGKNDNKKLVGIDINSSYPSQMLKQQPQQYQSTQIFEKEIKLEFDDIVDTNLYCIRFEQIDKTQTRTIGCLLVKTGKQLLSPSECKEFSFHWGVEIKEQILCGFDIYCNKIHLYKIGTPFSQFIQKLYKLRKEEKLSNNGEDSVLSDYYKLLMNSLYGKFGQTVKEQVMICSHISQFNLSNKDGEKQLVDFVEISDEMILIKYQQLGEEQKGCGNLIRFSSYITSLGRVQLSQTMRQIGFERVFYTDTDSILFQVDNIDKIKQEKWYDQLIDESTLGKWKIEKICNEGIFVCPKVYFLDDQIKNKFIYKMKGIRSQDITDIKNTYQKLLNDESVQILNPNQFTRTLTEVFVNPQIRTIKKIQNKRLWKNGISYIPTFEQLQ